MATQSKKQINDQSNSILCGFLNQQIKEDRGKKKRRNGKKKRKRKEKIPLFFSAKTPLLPRYQKF
jgi:hypothetical protein